MNEEEIYTFNEYILGYEKGNNDRSCLTISKIINDDMYFMSSLYDGSADVISMILDNLQKENQQLKQQLQQRDNIINKAKEKCKNKGKMDYDVWLYLSETIKTLEGFSKHIDYNLHPIITEAYKCEVRNCINELCEVVKYKLIYKDELLEILNIDKGDE